MAGGSPAPLGRDHRLWPDLAAFLVIRSGDRLDNLGKAEIALAGVTLALGIAALIWAEAAVAGALLGVFMFGGRSHARAHR